MRASELIKILSEICEDYHTDPIIEVEIDPVYKKGRSACESLPCTEAYFKRQHSSGFDYVILRKT